MESKSRAFKEHGVQNWTFFLDVVKGAREPGNLLPLLRRKAVEVDLEHKIFFCFFLKLHQIFLCWIYIRNSTSFLKFSRFFFLYRCGYGEGIVVLNYNAGFKHLDLKNFQFLLLMYMFITGLWCRNIFHCLLNE